MLVAPTPIAQRLKSASLFSAHSSCISRGVVVAVLNKRRHAVAASNIVEGSAMVGVALRDDMPSVEGERTCNQRSRLPIAPDSF